ncbi:SIMPL domain-containing protein [Albibacillus kandeliae]|uniref:SIMPL domain-containing protein n=1 Tax=Albibacillus kandeliae TaxID=2174228 RepID=UPI001E443F91|nr:SIMPL domain-containing protein [Albibacillus kandeliae]
MTRIANLGRQFAADTVRAGAAGFRAVGLPCLVLCLGLSQAAPVLAEAAPMRQITVTGEGTAEAEPDMARITLGVTHQQIDASDAMSATSDDIARITSRLQSLGVAPRDLQTQSISLSPVWSDSEPGREDGAHRITGFVASSTIMVRVRDLDGLGPLLDAVMAGGANDFSGLQFSVTDPKPLENAARTAAVKDAMAKAVLLADAAGVNLGPIQSISDHGGGGGPVMMDMAPASFRKGAMPISSGEISVGANVTVVFSIVGE